MPPRRSAPILAAFLAIGAVWVAPDAAVARSTVAIDLPSTVSSGGVAAATIHLPRSVRAIDGRVLLDSDSAELIGVAQLGVGTALAPVKVSGGYAFGAYGMAPVKGVVDLRLVFLPKVSGNLELRVLVDALADARGRRLKIGPSQLLATVRVDRGSRRLAAPSGSPRGAPTRAAGRLRPVFGRPVISVDDLDAVRASWYSTRERASSCVPGGDSFADANRDGCIDIVDLQAVLAAQGTRVTTSGAVDSASAGGGTPSATEVKARLASQASPARTFTVNSTADTPDATPGNALCADAQGACTLRAALTESNWQTGLTRIAFALAGPAPVTIQLGSSNLPTVGTANASVLIDGYSQPGSVPNDAAHGTNAVPGVEVRGAGNSTSQWIFYVPRAGNTFQGLLLSNANRGIFLDGPAAAGNVIVGNWIGFNRDGTLPPRGSAGVTMNNGAHDNVIGTAVLADRNVIGNWDRAILGNGPGSDSNTIQNNVLCMRPNGAGAICQAGVDFDFGPKNSLIGGSGPNEGNVVGPTCCNAVELSHGWDPSGAGGYSAKWQISGNRVIGNWLGFRSDGSYDPAYRSAQSVPTYDNGQAVNVYDGSLNNLVEGNYVASAYDGMTIGSSTSTGNTLRNNIIGRSPLGEPAPMAGWGIYLRWDTHVHTIFGNQISNAAMGGIGLIEYDVGGVTISRNTVDATDGPAIYFAPDPNNPATGANGLLAGPSLSAIASLVSGTGIPGATVEVFRASRPPGSTGLPTEFLGSAVVDDSGDWAVPVGLADGDVVTALQTRADGTTSLLAANVLVGQPANPPSASFSWSQVSGTLMVDFSDTSTGQPASWSWDFGDGAQSVAQSPSHAYSAAGDYSVTLTATNSAGPSSTTQTVHVDAVPVNSTFAVDHFGRTMSAGWGAADLGGDYTLAVGAADYSVAAGAGVMNLPKAGNTRSATLAGVSATSVDLVVRVAANKLPAGASQYVYVIARSIGNSSYRPKMILYPNGSVAVHAGVMLNNSESPLGPAVTVPGLTSVAGSYIWLRTQVTGTDPTTVRVKAWRDGDTEPADWQFSATNSAAALQAPGGTGLAAYIGSGTSNAPLAFSFDDFSAIDPAAGSGGAPTASFSWTQQPNTLSVAFSDISTGSPTSWSWDFGDGTSSTERNPTKIYATGGAYSVTLTAANGFGQTAATQLVSVNEPAQAEPLAQDGFSRTVEGDWGTADLGGPYSASGGPSALSVNGETGMIVPPRPGATRGVLLDGVSARDVDMRVRVAADKRPAGGTAWVYAAARHEGNNEYRPKILFRADGSIAVHAGVVVSDTESPIGQPVTVPGLTYTAGTFIWLRAQVTGANPTTINVRAWVDGTTEPTVWQYTATNSNSALQSAGSVGLRVYPGTSITNAPIAFSFDDYAVADPNAPPPVATTAVLVGAGDIGACGGSAAATAAVIAGIDGTVFTAGDNAYPDGSAQDFADCYAPAWGPFLARTRPVPGNHDYQTPGAAGYFGYFGSNAGPAGRGYYSYEAGAWRVYALNSECAAAGSCTAQFDWLAADLAAAPHLCTLAIWHRPRFSSGPHGGANGMASLFQLLYDAGVELLVSGHDHMYERLAPADPSGAADAARGVRQMVVGTGGAALYESSSPIALSEAQNNTTFGVLRLDLASSSYSWQFLPAGSGTYTDSGSTSCH